jgi:hypothetical protein
MTPTYRIRTYKYLPDGSLIRGGTFLMSNIDSARGFLHLYINSGTFDILELDRPYLYTDKLWYIVEAWRRSETGGEYARVV